MGDYSIGVGYKPKYSDNFTSFDYVDLESKQGGVIKLSAFGTFESLNPFLLKSLAPTGLTNLVFETLMERSLDEPSSSYGHIASNYILSDTSYLLFIISKVMLIFPMAIKSQQMT